MTSAIEQPREWWVVRIFAEPRTTPGRLGSDYYSADLGRRLSQPEVIALLRGAERGALAILPDGAFGEPVRGWGEQQQADEHVAKLRKAHPHYRYAVAAFTMLSGGDS
jgi:hypothetical protein